MTNERKIGVPPYLYAPYGQDGGLFKTGGGGLRPSEIAARLSEPGEFDICHKCLSPSLCMSRGCAGNRIPDLSAEINPQLDLYRAAVEHYEATTGWAWDRLEPAQWFARDPESYLNRRRAERRRRAFWRRVGWFLILAALIGFWTAITQFIEHATHGI